MNTYEFRFSPSSYKEYQQCGLRFRYNRIDDETPREESSHHRWFGRVVHDLIYAGLAEKEGTKDFVLRNKPVITYPLNVYRSIWNGKNRDDLGNAIVEQVGEVPHGTFFEGRINALKGTQAEIERGWRAQGEKMIRNGITTLTPIHTNIVELEQKLLWEYLGRRFIGYIDVLTKEDDRFVFYDLKTSWGKPSEAALHRDFQFFSYSHGLRQKYNLDYYPEGRWVHLKDGDIRKFQVTEDVVEAHEKVSIQLFQQMENNVFPSIFGSPLCRYCDFSHLCYGEDYKWE